MNASTAIFIVLSAVAVVSALNVIFRRNPVHSAVFLAMTIVSIAGMFILLNSEFIAAIEVIVYAGAIIVLFLFTMMLLDIRGGMTSRQLQSQFKLALPVALLLLVAVGAVAVGTVNLSGLPPANISAQQAALLGSVQNLGQELYSNFLLPFELASLVLTVGLVGAIGLAGRGIEDAGELERIQEAEEFDADIKAEEEVGPMEIPEDIVPSGQHG
ncbi:MAG: NADH-quinone oxidoreductase subunit J [Chloroflexota bacterium]|nr:NADH-quinone oxidoreductase subunit J [Chloroflexota bacterium]